MQTERLTLRAYRMVDFPAVAALYQSPRAAYIDGPQTDIRVWAGFGCDVGQWVLMGFGCWSVTLKSGTLIGQCGLNKPVDYPENELGWVLFDGCEGQGYATEAARAARHFAFETMGFDTLVSYIDPDNAASIRVAERLGAVLDPAAVPPDATTLVYRHRRVA